MQFRTEIFPPKEAIEIDYNSRIFTIGSCFTEHMGKALSDLKFEVLTNPFGIVYNPISISRQIERIAELQAFHAGDLFYSDGVYRTFEAHSDMADYTIEAGLQKLNSAIAEGNAVLQNLTHAIITFGTSIVYELADTNVIVANNHKQPAGLFRKRYLSLDEITGSLRRIIELLRRFNAAVRIIFTVSPIRHFREGLVANTRSKALLFAALHEVGELQGVYYFPSFELVTDDLRDYRFYERDLVHPNAAAVEYVWEKFKLWAIDSDCYPLMEDIMKINNAIRHRPFFENTPQHKKFKENMHAFVLQLLERNPSLHLEKELAFFR